MPDARKGSGPADRGARLAALRAAFPYTIPIMTGFLFLGAAYGMYMNVSGFPPAYPILMSLTVFAGSMEFVAADLLLGAFDPLRALALTLMVNARHLFYGISLLDKYRAVPGRKRRYLIFGMCDESFSINAAVSVPEGVDRGWFYFFVTLLNHSYWVCGAALGGVFGTLLEVDLEGLEFVMTALLAVLFLEQLLKERDHTSALLGVGLSAACLVLFGSEGFVIPAMLAIVGALTLLRRPLERREAEVRP